MPNKRIQFQWHSIWNENIEEQKYYKYKIWWRKNMKNIHFIAKKNEKLKLSLCSHDLLSMEKFFGGSLEWKIIIIFLGVWSMKVNSFRSFMLRLHSTLCTLLSLFFFRCSKDSHIFHFSQRFFCCRQKSRRFFSTLRPKTDDDAALRNVGSLL